MQTGGVWKGAAAVAVVLAVGYAVREGVRFSRAGRATQPAPMVEMKCSSCGAETSLKVGEMPMTCPSCGERTLELAAYCRACDETLPMLDSAAYLASPAVAMSRATEVFPKCPGCGRLMVPKMVVSGDIADER